MQIETFDWKRLAEYAALLNLSRGDRPEYRALTPEQVSASYSSDPGYRAEGHFVALTVGKMIGEAVAFLDQGKSNTQTHCRGDLRMSVTPEYRKCGVGRALVERACEYLYQHGASTVGTVVPRSCEEMRRFYEGLGFRPCGSSNKLAYNTGDALPSAVPPLGYSLRPACFPEDRDRFLNTWLQSFGTGESGGLYISPETFDDFLTFPGVEVAYFIVERCADKAAVGAISCFVDPDYNSRNEVSEGTIEVVAVLESDRKRGIGAALIAAALHWMQGMRIRTVLAHVAGANTASMGLARKLGFKLVDYETTYETSFPLAGRNTHSDGALR